VIMFKEPVMKTSFCSIAAAAALALAPALSSAATSVQLGAVSAAPGQTVMLPVTLTLDADLSLFALTATISFDTTRLSVNAGAPFWLGGLSLNDLAVLPGFAVMSDALGVVIDAATFAPLSLPAAGSPYSYTMSFTAGPMLGLVPVMLNLSLCDNDCLLADPAAPTLLTAAGSVNVVPEPATWALMAGGLLVVGRLAARRRAAA